MRSGGVLPFSERVFVRVAFPSASYVGSSSWNGVKISLVLLSSYISVVTTSWRFSTSLMMVDISRVLSWFLGDFLRNSR